MFGSWQLQEIVRGYRADAVNEQVVALKSHWGESLSFLLLNLLFRFLWQPAGTPGS